MASNDFASMSVPASDSVSLALNRGKVPTSLPAS
jgi:hypothetical protein